MLLETIAFILVILLSLPIVSKLFVRIVWFLFPYSSLALQLRTIIVGKLIATHMKLGKESPQYYRTHYGRACVRILHTEHGHSPGDIGYITEELFGLLAQNLAPHLGYTRGVVFIEEDASVFQFWDAE